MKEDEMNESPVSELEEISEVPEEEGSEDEFANTENKASAVSNAQYRDVEEIKT